MAHGTLEVVLVSAKGLHDKDSISKMDPYAVLTYRTQEKKSSVVSGGGSSPEWNESFLFSISSDFTELRIKIMDKDTFTADDFVGEAKIGLESVFAERNIPPMWYNVVKGEKYCGEIKVALTFTHQRNRDGDVGGWKESCMQ